tara:strand:+ start:320 stop:598 length:279 start_codon:yes stop_codon:yes gene_type:complete
MTHPYDNWPVAKDKTPTERLHDDMRRELGYENPRPEEEIADTYASRHESTPDFEKDAEEIVTRYEKMYRMTRGKDKKVQIKIEPELGEYYDE